MSESRIDRALAVLAKRHGRAPRTSGACVKHAKRPRSQQRSDEGGGSGTDVKETPASRVARDGRPQGQVQITSSHDFKAQSGKATLRKAGDEASEDAVSGLVPAANFSAAMVRALDELDRGIKVDTEVANKYVGEAENEYRMCMGLLDAVAQDIASATSASNASEQDNEQEKKAVSRHPLSRDDISRKRTIGHTITTASAPEAMAPGVEAFRNFKQGEADDMPTRPSLKLDDELFADFASQSVPLRGLAKTLKKRLAEEGDDVTAQPLCSPLLSRMNEDTSSKTTKKAKAKTKIKVMAKSKAKAKGKGKGKQRAKAKAKAKTTTKSSKARAKAISSSQTPGESPRRSPKAQPPRRTRKKRLRARTSLPEASNGSTSSLAFSPKEKRNVEYSTRMASRLSALRRSMEQISLLSATVVGNGEGVGHEDTHSEVATFDPSLGLDLLLEGTAARARRAPVAASSGGEVAAQDADDPALVRAAASYARAFADGLRKSLEGPRLAAIAARLRKLEQRIQAAVTMADETPMQAGLRGGETGLPTPSNVGDHNETSARAALQLYHRRLLSQSISMWREAVLNRHVFRLSMARRAVAAIRSEGTRAALAKRSIQTKRERIQRAEAERLRELSLSIPLEGYQDVDDYDEYQKQHQNETEDEVEDEEEEEEQRGGRKKLASDIQDLEDDNEQGKGSGDGWHLWRSEERRSAFEKGKSNKSADEIELGTLLENCTKVASDDDLDALARVHFHVHLKRKILRNWFVCAAGGDQVMKLVLEHTPFTM